MSLKTVNYIDIIRELMSHGFLLVDTANDHVRLQQEITGGQIRLTFPASESLRYDTVRRIVRDSGLKVDDFGELLEE